MQQEVCFWHSFPQKSVKMHIRGKKTLKRRPLKEATVEDAL